MTNPDELLADFGPYKLVVRPASGGYVAVLWRESNGERARRLLECWADSLDGAKAEVERLFYQQRLKETLELGAAEEPYARAWSYLWPKLTDNQRAMIDAQYHAPGRTMTTIELAKSVGWTSHSSVNLWYGLAGFALFGEVPREISEKNGMGAPVYSFALSTGERVNANKHWSWTLRPAVAEGLIHAGCIAD